MSREDVISLLTELVAVCGTFMQASIVALTRDNNSGEWGLRAKWIAQRDEKDCLSRVALQRGFHVVESDGYTVILKK